jgi:hypothetical protein
MIPRILHLALSVMLLAGALRAAPVVTTAVEGPNDPSTLIDELAFASDISTSDLLHGIAGTGGTWITNNGADPDGLNDGSNGGDYNAVGLPDALDGAAFASDGDGTSWREFELGTGSGGLGYDITEIQSIAAWQGGGLGNQKYTVSVRYLGAATFTTLTTVEYQPFSDTQAGATKVNLTDDTGVLASGVEAIRFDILDTVSAASAGPVFREIDVFGVESESPVVFHSGYSGTASVVGNSVEMTYAADASDSDLLHGLTAATTGTWYTSNDASVTYLNDGLHGESYADAGNTTQGAWPEMDATATFVLGTGANGTGYDLSLIQSIAAWQGGGLGNQAWTIAVSLVGDPATFIDLASVDFQPFPAELGAPGSGGTKVTLSGLDATGVHSIRVTCGEVQNAGFSNGFIWRELDVFGVPTSGGGDPALRIMPIGDSITVGYTNSDWSGGAWEYGYRSGLYTLLSGADYDFVFVGSSTEPESFRDPETTDPAWPPAIDLVGLGQAAHNGYQGQNATFVNANILTWLAADNPDIILLMIGTVSQDQSGLDTLVNTITTTKPDAQLIIAEIIPKYTYQQAVVDYNSYIRNTLVPYYQSLGRNVTLVDQYAPFLTDPGDLTTIDQSLFSNGINHPDNDGYNKMARVWFDGIQALGLGPDTFNNWIANYPEVGSQNGFDDDPDGDGKANGLENYLGTNPGDADSDGLAAGDLAMGESTTFTFTHPVNDDPAPASDIAPEYRWSENLSTWHGSGQDNGAGTSVSFLQVSVADGVATVEAVISGPVPGRLFVNLAVTPD